MRAVTVWSLLGSFNWCHLCTLNSGDYEPGVFHLKDGQPQATLLTELVRRITNKKRINPIMMQERWWLRNDRVTIPPP